MLTLHFSKLLPCDWHFVQIFQGALGPAHSKMNNGSFLLVAARSCLPTKAFKNVQNLSWTCNTAEWSNLWQCWNNGSFCWNMFFLTLIYKYTHYINFVIDKTSMWYLCFKINPLSIYSLHPVQRFAPSCSLADCSARWSRPRWITSYGITGTAPCSLTSVTYRCLPGCWCLCLR